MGLKQNDGLLKWMELKNERMMLPTFESNKQETWTGIFLLIISNGLLDQPVFGKLISRFLPTKNRLRHQIIQCFFKNEDIFYTAGMYVYRYR